MVKKKADTLVEQLRAAIVESGMSDNRLGNEAGVPSQTLGRFKRGERDLTLETASRIAAYLGLELTRRKGA